MKKINKKILYGMGAISIVASPIIAVVACGSETPKKPTPPKPTPPKPSIPKINPIVNIDLDKIKSPMELILKMNDSMHFKSDTPYTEIGKQNTSGEYPLTKDQYKKMANNVITDIAFHFTYKGESLGVSSNLNKDTMIVKNSIDQLIND
jgi:hypothetical protein